MDHYRHTYCICCVVLCIIWLWHIQLNRELWDFSDKKHINIYIFNRFLRFKTMWNVKWKGFLFRKAQLLVDICVFIQKLIFPHWQTCIVIFNHKYSWYYSRCFLKLMASEDVCVLVMTSANQWSRDVISCRSRVMDSWSDHLWALMRRCSTQFMNFITR